ncbi:MAG: hypothetical protein EOP37_11110 [Rubrivivax sp.]|nr:MAG: hypothetical protein EOP37_11110 [Rubrivivax sp.]
MDHSLIATPNRRLDRAVLIRASAAVRATYLEIIDIESIDYLDSPTPPFAAENRAFASAACRELPAGHCA